MTEKYDTINHHVLDIVATSAFPNCTILDVGCWTGNLGFALKGRLNYPITIDGIENNCEALRIVKSRGCYNEVYNFDLNNTNLTLARQYDIIVLADVLEHLLNPEKTLQEILNNLNPQGWAVVSLPNIAFIKYRLLHLFGKWNYRTSGIMDKTHLHFYTLDTMHALFSTCNLRVVEQQVSVAIPKRYFYISLFAKFFPRMLALQFVFKLSLTKKW